MRYVAAYLLAALGGNENPSEADIKNILASVGIESDENELKQVVGQLKGKALEEVIAEGQEKLASVPSGGGAAPAAGGAVPAAAAPAAGGGDAKGGKKDDKKEEKKEEKKKEEKKEEEEEGMDGFSLFD